jgi:hypothetical protein
MLAARRCASRLRIPSRGRLPRCDAAPRSFACCSGRSAWQLKPAEQAGAARVRTSGSWRQSDAGLLVRVTTNDDQRRA